MQISLEIRRVCIIHWSIHYLLSGRVAYCFQWKGGKKDMSFMIKAAQSKGREVVSVVIVMN